MSAFRITLSFDLDIGDEEAARQVAHDFLTNISLQTVAEGGRVEGDSAAAISSPRAVASAVAVELLARGADTVPGISVGNLNVSNEQR